MSKVFEEVDPGYAATCSNATLCSNPKGFFRDLADNLVELAKKNDWLSQEFEKRNGDAEKISAVYENEEVRILHSGEKYNIYSTPGRLG